MQKVSAVLLKQPQITALACVAYFTSRATSLDDPFLKDNDKSSSINFTIVSDLIDIPSLSSMCLQISFERNGASGRKIKCEATYFTNLELNFFLAYYSQLLHCISSTRTMQGFFWWWSYLINTYHLWSSKAHAAVLSGYR